MVETTRLRQRLRSSSSTTTTTTTTVCRPTPATTLSQEIDSSNDDLIDAECEKNQTDTCPVILLLLIGGTFLYLYLRERHIGCYTPVNGKVCFTDTPDSKLYKWFGTKTDYNVTVQQAKDEYDQQLSPPGCQPVLFYMFQRHTTRYPDRKKIQEQAVILEQLKESILSQEKSRLCKGDLQELANWQYPFVPDQDNLVMPQGNRVVQDQVYRLKKRFPHVFRVERRFENSTVQVDWTSRVRSKETAYAFMSAWFSKDVFEGIIRAQIEQNTNDKLNQFHRTCSEQLKKSGNYIKTPEAVNKLEHSSYYSSLLETLSSRLGRKITMADMKAMYSQCQFESAMQGRSIWCSAFTKEDLQLLEFRDDLDDFYKDSFGNTRNWRQACPVAQDLFEYMNEVESPSYVSENTRTVLHFSHAGAIKKVFAYFGIGKGPAVEWHDACSHRDWRSSHISPFNANLIFVVYNCSEGQKQIVTLVNEKMTKLDGCSSLYCSVEEFREAYQKFTSDCDLSAICS